MDYTKDCTKDCYYFRNGKCRREGTRNECRLGVCLFYAPIPYRVKKEEFNCFGAGSGGVQIKKKSTVLPKEDA